MSLKLRIGGVLAGLLLLTIIVFWLEIKTLLQRNSPSWLDSGSYGAPLRTERHRFCLVVNYNQRWFMHDDSSYTMLNWHCYCEKHNISFYPVFHPWYRAPFFFRDRWTSVRNLFPLCEYILAMDADVVMANISYNPLDEMGEDKSMMFSFRENRETIAGLMIIKTDTRATTFMDKWMGNYGTIHNADNGALIKTLLQETGNADQCDTTKLDYNREWVPCAHRYISQGIPGFIFKHPGELWRSHECGYPCSVNDKFLHGCKHIGRELVDLQGGCVQFENKTHPLNKCRYDEGFVARSATYWV